MDVTLQQAAAGPQSPVAAGSSQQLRQTQAPVPALTLPSSVSIAQLTSTAKSAEPSAEDLKAAAAKVSQAMAIQSPDEMEFAIDKGTGKSVVRILDGSTGKLIQQFPSEQMLEIAQSIGSVHGLLLNQKA